MEDSANLWLLFPLVIICAITGTWIPIIVVISIPLCFTLLVLSCGFILAVCDLVWIVVKSSYEWYLTPTRENPSEYLYTQSFVINPNGSIDMNVLEPRALFSIGITRYTIHSANISTTSEDKMAFISTSIFDMRDGIKMRMFTWYHKFTDEWQHLTREDLSNIQAPDEQQFATLYNEFMNRVRIEPLSYLITEQLELTTGHKFVKIRRGGYHLI